MTEIKMPAIIAGYVKPSCPHCDEELANEEEPPGQSPIQCPFCHGWIRIKLRTVYLVEQVFDYAPTG